MKPCEPLAPFIFPLAHYTEPAEVIEASLDKGEAELKAWRAEQNERFNRFLRNYKIISFLRALIGLPPRSTKHAPIDEWKKSFDSPTLFWLIEPPSDETRSKSLDDS